MTEIGEIIVDKDNNNIMEILMLLLKNPLPYIRKNSELVVVTLLEKELSKISLLVSMLCLLLVVLFFIELVVLRTLLPCL